MKEKSNKIIYLIPIIIFVILILLIILNICFNKKNTIDKSIYSTWTPNGAQIENGGNYSNYDDYDKEGYIVISPLEISRCVRNDTGYNNCNNYSYVIDNKLIDIKSEDKYLSGKYSYEINENKLKLIRKNDDGSKIIYSYGSPAG